MLILVVEYLRDCFTRSSHSFVYYCGKVLKENMMVFLDCKQGNFENNFLKLLVAFFPVPFLCNNVYRDQGSGEFLGMFLAWPNSATSGKLNIILASSGNPAQN